MAPQYYESAISVMKEKFQKPVFFVFSDDIPWVKVNLNIPNAYYIDWISLLTSCLTMIHMKLQHFRHVELASAPM